MDQQNKKYSCSHVIFDLDGIILDTEPLYEEIIDTVLKRYGKKLDTEFNLKRRGLTGPDLGKYLIEYYNLKTTPEKIYKEAKELYPKIFVKAKVFEGAERLINHLYDHKIPLAVATGSSVYSYELKSKNYKDLLKKFHHITFAGSDPDVKRGKSEPDVFLVCASKFDEKLAPSKCLVIEDSISGIEAAYRAQMPCVMVPHKSVQKDHMTHADLIIDSLFDFKPELFGLPPFPEKF